MKKIFDITKYACPISFIKAKILLDNLMPGEKAILRLKGQDTAKSLPKTLEEDGYTILNSLNKKKEIYELLVLKK